jgi:hypothetical protein
VKLFSPQLKSKNDRQIEKGDDGTDIVVKLRRNFSLAMKNKGRGEEIPRCEIDISRGIFYHCVEKIFAEQFVC